MNIEEEKQRDEEFEKYAVTVEDISIITKSDRHQMLRHRAAILLTASFVII